MTAGYRATLALLVLGALAVQYVHSSRVAALDPVNFFGFFTNLSNLFGALVFLACALTGGRARGLDLARGTAVVYLAATGVVYALLLADVSESLGLVLPWVNTVAHELMLVAVVIDWVVVPPSHRISSRWALAWLTFPVAYIVYSLIRGARAHWYPYPFLDPALAGGYGGVAAYAVGIAIGFTLLALAIVWVGNALGARVGAPTLATA